MRIGLDLRMLGGGSGISRYIFELSQKILEMDKKNEYVLFFRRADESADYKKFNRKIVITGIPHYSVAEQLRLPRVLNKENLDLVHFPHFNVPIFYRKPFIVTIHDLTHSKFPGRKKSHFFHRLAYNFVLSNAIKSAKKIIAVSNGTKNEIQEVFGNVDDKTVTIYEGANDSFRMMDKQEAFDQIANRFGISKPFILYVGVWRRYKNLPMLARAFSRMIDKGLDLQLVLAGEPDPFYPEIKQQILSVNHSDHIVCPGRVSDSDMQALYNAATLFVLPSLSEGFGLTALEAASCGVPIVSSDIPTLREILGQGAEYFDPNNLENMTDVLENLLKNEKRLEELANLGLSRSKHFNWKMAAQETINLYGSVVG
ncbi:MAG: glycosyltransferase family 4 protein [Candidatus Doudnabacteria bacterium]|nr:glycosyltransferase family 4 protein [Candidatus Doudnabacteria bacterium]